VYVIDAAWFALAVTMRPALSQPSISFPQALMIGG
jgi:hypothetical protein